MLPECLCSSVYHDTRPLCSTMLLPSVVVVVIVLVVVTIVNLVVVILVLVPPH